MKKPITALGLAVASLGFAAAAPAAWDHRNDYSGTLTAPTDAIHSGGMSASDQALARDVATALARDSVLYGATVTVVVHNGAVSLGGSAESGEQASRAESIARGVAGVTSVSGTLDVQGS